jgi:very-short-patch-repair endonuclease
MSEFRRTVGNALYPDQYENHTQQVATEATLQCDILPSEDDRQLYHYIVDFYCKAAQLVIEIDGGQHYQEEAMLRDAKRDIYLRGMGLTVLRFSNLDVLKCIDGVIGTIVKVLEEKGLGWTDKN